MDSRFTDTTRQAAAYRDRLVLLAGDAAHVHAPDGGQGLNTSVQDAVYLGWKLAQVVKGTSPDRLLDTYHAGRHPIAARVLRNTMASVTLHAARPVLINFGEGTGFDLTRWADRVRLVEARCDGPWDLPVIGPVPPPAAVLIRPDGYVAWAGEPGEPALVDALTRCVGPSGVAEC